MNADDQAQLGARLEAGLAAAGLTVERVDVIHGNVRGWQPVAGETIVGKLTTFGWRVRHRPPPPEGRSLKLLDSGRSEGSPRSDPMPVRVRPGQ